MPANGFGAEPQNSRRSNYVDRSSAGSIGGGGHHHRTITTDHRYVYTMPLPLSTKQRQQRQQHRQHRHSLAQCGCGTRQISDFTVSFREWEPITRPGALRNRSNLRAVVALNGERRPMKLYENVINALFVSFRSKGRGVIRNAFAPRDGGHLLLSLPHLASTFRLPLSLSLSLSLSPSSLFPYTHPFFFPHQAIVRFPLSHSLFFCTSFFLALPPHYSLFLFQTRKSRDLEKTRRTTKKKKVGGEWWDGRTRPQKESN